MTPQKQQTKRDWCRENGICQSCLKRPVIPGFSQCQLCKDRQGKSYIKRRNIAIDKSICVICGGPTSGLLKCEQCAQVTRAISKQMRDDARAAGICMQCKKNKVSEGYATCAGCRKLSKLHRDELITKKLCVTCYKPCDGDTTQCSVCLASKRQSRLDIKVEVLAHYGGKCACCQTPHHELLNIDHPNNNGAEQRRLLFGNKDKAGHSFYSWLKKQGFPTGYRVLCFSCNFSFYHFGYCPHQREKK